MRCLSPWTIVLLCAFGTLLASSAHANPIKRQEASAAKCTSYVIIQTRGTNEKQGPSDGFVLANAFTLATVLGGNQYYTVYPAALDQISQEATTDIITRTAEFVKADPTQCIILQGYSQGAAATVNALALLNGTAADAVKAVFLIGNPLHKPGLSCNVDANGGNSSMDALGLQLNLFPDSNTVPDAFLNRTMDVCIPGDGVCDSKNGVGYGSQGQHLLYGDDVGLQMMAYIFLSSVLNLGTYVKPV